MRPPATAIWPAAQAILVVNGNPAQEHFVVDLVGKRAIRAGGKLIYIGPDRNRTAQFAEICLDCQPGTQSAVVLGLLSEYGRATGGRTDMPADVAAAIPGLTPEEVERRTGADAQALREAARLLATSTLKVMVFNRDFRGMRQAGDNRLLAAVASALGCGLLPLHEKANMQGLLDMGGAPGWYPGYQSVATSAVIDEFETAWGVALRDIGHGAVDVATLLAEKKIKVALVLGEDPLGCASLPSGDQRRAPGDGVPRRGRPVPHRHRSSRARRVAVLQRRGNVRNLHELRAPRPAVPPRDSAAGGHRDLGHPRPTGGTDGMRLQDQLRQSGGDLRRDPPGDSHLP